MYWWFLVFNILGVIFVTLGAVFIHEVGHYLQAKEMGYKPFFRRVKGRYFSVVIPGYVPPQHFIKILEVGVLIGYVFCIFGFLFVFPFSILPFVIYSFGLGYDLRTIKNLRCRK